MTTGEKITKLRKENNFTQEELACILNVSRQSVSKWESDGAFPETEKIIQLSKLFHCSVDYLLKDECDAEFCKYEKEIEVIKEKKPSKTGEEIKRNLAFKIVMMVFGIASLLLFIAPWVRCEFSSGGYITNNVYQLLQLMNFGNFMVIIQFVCVLLILMLGLIFFFINNKVIYRLIVILEFITTISSLIVCLTANSNCCAMAIAYFVICTALFIVLVTVNELKFDELRSKEPFIKKIASPTCFKNVRKNIGFNVISYIAIITELVCPCTTEFYYVYDSQNSIHSHSNIFNISNTFSAIYALTLIGLIAIHIFLHILFIMKNNNKLGIWFRVGLIFIPVLDFATFSIVSSIYVDGHVQISSSYSSIVMDAILALLFALSFIPVFNFKRKAKIEEPLNNELVKND